MKKTESADPIGAFEQRLLNAMARCREFKVVPEALTVGIADAHVRVSAESVTEESVRGLCLLYGPPEREDIHRVAWSVAQIEQTITAEARDEEEFARWSEWARP